ncbi:MAG: alpha/beta hydrolase [Opitutales bacterium]|nr:alpha/beta hydrolase [Opitutales bacterium]
MPTPTKLRVNLDHPVVTVPVNGGERSLVVDLWIPEAARPLPYVVYIHGGGWRGGTQYRPPFAPRMWEDGIATVAVTYRFSGEAVFPAQTEDCAAMLRWLRENAAHHGLDPARYALWGISAGAHLSALLSLELSRSAPGQKCAAALTQPRAGVHWCGPTDLPRTAVDPFPGRGMVEMVGDLLGGPISAREDLARTASPVHHAHGDAPPQLIVHGARDPIVPVWHATAYAEALRAAGAPHELLLLEERDHNLGEAEEAGATRDFLRKHLAP